MFITGKRIYQIARLIFVILLFSCSGPKTLQNSPDIDTAWQGVWSGPALVDDSKTPPKNFALEIEFTSTDITGYFTVRKAGVVRRVVHDLQLNGDEIKFRVPYQTKLIMRSFMKFTGTRNGRNLVATFDGREGGKAYTGKWQARKMQE
ncbi:MAG: hypothetical protein H6696_06845 [Deferribacteres bacterium]|nr:hypothetical protein [candidate division KSB1 bacterium]MCB9501639.1 hypothetical protein [Deferribacteres bacterium]